MDIYRVPSSGAILTPKCPNRLSMEIKLSLSTMEPTRRKKRNSKHTQCHFVEIHVQPTRASGLSGVMV